MLKRYLIWVLNRLSVENFFIRMSYPDKFYQNPRTRQVMMHEGHRIHAKTFHPYEYFYHTPLTRKYFTGSYEGITTFDGEMGSPIIDNKYNIEAVLSDPYIDFKRETIFLNGRQPGM